MLRTVLCITMVVLGLVSARADNRSDTFDILHTNIQLDVTDFAGKTISGQASITFVPKMDLDRISLDLLGLQVDSVKLVWQHLSYTYNDTLLTAVITATVTPDDTLTIDVFYSGSPVRDGNGTGWGGWYWSGTYAYNLGVGFQADPHNYGRVWFPCLDNFVERSTFEFHITTDSTKRAFCNGLENIPVTVNGNGTRTWHWRMEESIPSYLVSVAVADYTTLEWTHGGVPVKLAVRPSDSANMRASFVHLNDAIDAFSNAYGPHFFSRVGFTVVPFNGGAMEHATNIAYPLFAIDGTTDRETLMAHELAHHWWGDLVTCRTAEDMWINEGMASYSEQIFMEHVHGTNAFLDYSRVNHEDVLHYAHIRDGAYEAISGVDHSITYGDHSYNKGASVAHNLRNQLGDDFFFDCVATFMSNYAFQAVDKNMLRDHLEACSGRELDDFFDNWVSSPGYPHFSIDSFVVTGGTPPVWNVSVYLRQRKSHAPEYYGETPLELRFFDKDGNSKLIGTRMDGRCAELQVTLDFIPEAVLLDPRERLHDAQTHQYQILSGVGTVDYEQSHLEVEVTQYAGRPIHLWVSHNWIPPDRMINPISGLILSDRRYWKVDGVLPPGTTLEGTLVYDGRASMSGGYLDQDLLSNSEDSLILMYRPGPGHEWVEHNNYTRNILGSPNDRFGRMEITNLMLGEYTLATYHWGRTDTFTTDIPPTCQTIVDVPLVTPIGNVVIYPNPTSGVAMVAGNFDELRVYDMLGQLVTRTSTKRLDTSSWPGGTYLVNVENKGVSTFVKLIVFD